MKKITHLVVFCFLTLHTTYFSARTEFLFLKTVIEPDSTAYLDSLEQARVDSIESAILYKTGKISLSNNLFNVNVPQGFKFVEEKQAQYILEDIYGNPPDKQVLGLIFPDDRSVYSSDSYFFVVTYDDMGHVEDDDAEDTNYEELLEELKKDFKESNPERIKNGYEPCELIGWASQPYYDKDKKVLHWAKEVQFGTDTSHTLNYDVRVLGKAGVLILQAVSGMEQLPVVKQNINSIYNMVEFSEGNKYSNFDPSIDKIAAVGIGGLIAGKILAKAGILGFLIKFWKVIAVAVAGGGAAIVRFFRRKKNNNDSTPSDPNSDQGPAA
jgi:uncharacterized membrane-anchored protein